MTQENQSQPSVFNSDPSSSITHHTLRFLLRDLYSRQSNPEGGFRAEEVRQYIQRLQARQVSSMDDRARLGVQPIQDN